MKRPCESVVAPGDHGISLPRGIASTVRPATGRPSVSVTLPSTRAGGFFAASRIPAVGGGALTHATEQAAAQRKIRFTS